MAVTTGKVRASYVHIFTPRVPDNGGEAKYSVTLLIPKSDTATLNALYADIERAKQEGAQKAFSGNVPHPAARRKMRERQAAARYKRAAEDIRGPDRRAVRLRVVQARHTCSEASQPRCRR